MIRFFIPFFLVLFLFLFPFSSSADAYFKSIQGSGDYANTFFAVNAVNAGSSAEQIVNTSDILINITAWDKQENGNRKDVFTNTVINTKEKVYIRFEKPGYACVTDLTIAPVVTYLYGFSAAATAKSGSEADFVFNPQKTVLRGSNQMCTLESGTYKLSMWSSNSKTFMIENLDFPVNGDAGGSEPTLEYVTESSNQICTDKVTQVRVRNMVEGETYRLWWDGNIVNWAWKGKAEGNTMVLDLGGGDSLPGLRKNETNFLCLAKGDTSLPPAVAPKGQCSTSAGNTFLPFNFPEDQSSCSKVETQKCSVDIKPSANNTGQKRVTIIGTNLNTPVSDLRGDLVYRSNTPPTVVPYLDFGTNSGSGSNLNWVIEVPKGNYGVYLYPKSGSVQVCKVEFTVDDKIETGNTQEHKGPDFKTIACGENGEKCSNSSGQFCNTSTGQLAEDGNGVLTAIGCVPKDPAQLIAGLMKYITGFSGGVALLLMVFGSFQMMTSGGNADTLKKGREQFVSAVIGLLFVIFSTLLLQIIGVDILGLPGFTK